MTVGPMQFGTLNSAGSDETTLEADNATTTLLVENGEGDAVTGRAREVGVRGYGDPEGELGLGVYGQGSYGVFGFGEGGGVRGDSFDNRGGAGDGVQGLSNVRGHNGVFGYHYGSGVGVRARCDAGFGVYAESITSVGAGGTSGSGTGVQGIAGALGLAGAFFGRTAVVGDLEVHGSLTVIPPGAKSMAMAHPDGSHRRLYALESPESWIEDFGTSEIVEGSGRVEFDPDFAAIAQLTEYHVFLTPEGDTDGLYVAEKGPTGFEVREQRGGTSGVRFSYRVVARPRLAEGGPTQRLERVDVSRPAPVEVAAPATEPREIPVAAD